MSNLLYLETGCTEKQTEVRQLSSYTVVVEVGLILWRYLSKYKLKIYKTNQITQRAPIADGGYLLAIGVL